MQKFLQLCLGDIKERSKKFTSNIGQNNTRTFFIVIVDILKIYCDKREREI